MTTLRHTWIPLLLTTLGALASAQKPGDSLPSFEVSGLTQTEAKSVEDYFGRAMMLEFFAHWCGPCAQQVPHVNEIQERYGPKGLSVVGLTGSREDEKKTMAWIERHEAEYAWGYDPDSELTAWLGIRGIPHAVLIDPTGTIVWRGHPASLTDEVLESAVKGALVTPLWSNEAAADVREALAGKRFAQAMAAAQKVPADAEGEKILDLLQRTVARQLEGIEQAKEAGDFLTAQERAERAAKELAGLPQAVRAAEIVAALQKDETAQKVIGAQLDFRHLMAQLSEVKSRAAAEPVLTKLDELANAHPGTIVERQIRELQRRIGPSR